MKTAPVGRITHLMLGVRDVEASLAFYRDKLGLRVQSQFSGFAFLDAGSVMLILAEPLARNAATVAGCVQVVFSVEGVRESYDALRARHIEFIHEPHNVNGPQWAANFRDPDGHQLSLFGPECKAASVLGEAG